MNLENLTDETLKSDRALITAYLNEAGVDASSGTVVGDLVVKPGATLFSSTNAAFQDTLSNLAIDTADDAHAAALLSNYGLKVQSAGPGTGYLILFTESDEDLVVRRSTLFDSGGYSIELVGDYIGTVDYSELSSEVYVPLKKYDESRWYMLVEGVTLTDLTHPLLPGTEATPEQSVTGLSSAEVATSFLATRESRTLEDLKGKVVSGVSAKILAGPDHIKALLTESDELSVIDVSTVGMNEKEMLRDSDNIYGTSSGGHVDIYVKTTEYAHTKEIKKTATKVGDNRYKILLNKDDAPGFYYVKGVGYKDKDRTSDLGIFSYEFGVDLSEADPEPSFPENKDGRFSAYQNCAVEFNYVGVEAGDDSPEFTLVLVYNPLLSEVQDFVSDPGTRAPAADYVVKAVVPLFLSISINVSYNPSDDRPDESLIATVVADVVNKIPMGQRFLSGAEIACAVNKLYPEAVVKLPMALDAFTVDNKGSFHHVRSDDTLFIPDMPEQGVTAKTATFMTNPSDVGVRLTGDKK